MKHLLKRHVSFGVLAPLTLTLAASMAPMAAAQEASSGGGLDEIVVTAERRTESLQDVPISITALGAEALDTFEITTIEDFHGKVPSVVVNKYFGIATTFRAFIRGVGAVTVEATQDPAVALYQDGIYVGSSFGASFEPSDLERIEILRGPQGTLYGRNATGGAINLISRPPELGEWSFDSDLTFGNFNQQRLHAGFNVPLGDIAAARFSVTRSERDGFVENTGLGEDWGLEDRLGIRGAIRIEPTSNFDINFAMDYSKIQDTSRYAQVLSGAGDTSGIPLGPGVTVDTYYPDPITPYRLDTAHSEFELRPDDNDVFGASLTLDWRVSDNVSLKSITGYRQVDASQFADVSGTAMAFLNTPGPSFGPFPLLTVGAWYLNFEQLTQEFQVLGEATAFGGPLEYVSGVYYYRDSGENRDLTTSFTGPHLPGTDVALTDNESFAVFSQATFTPADGPVDVTIGARYSWDSREASRTNLNSNPPLNNVQYAQEFENFNPALTVTYNLSDDVNLYASAVTGYRSGATSTLSYTETLFEAGAQPEEIVSYELGTKGEYFDRRLRVNAAAFSMNYTDYQASIQTGLAPSQRDILNVGDVNIWGFEADISAAITDHLTVSASMGYLHSEFQEDAVDPGTGAPPTGLVDRLPYAPERTYMVSVDYARPVSDALDMAFNVNYAYQSDTLSGIAVGTAGIDDAHGLLDASLSFTHELSSDRTYRIKFWGQNLTDEEYVISNVTSFAGFGAGELTPFGDPLTFGVTLSYGY